MRVLKPATDKTAARSTWIRVKITEIVKISDLPLKFIITGYCPDIVLRECPFAFKALYSFISNKGKFVFSFKYGRWIEIDNSDIGEPNNYIKGMIIGKRKIMRV
ncbi:MAG: hypothetical protein NTW46_03735 [Candidatus Nealsonbacteria bacterium]|nr:hypothetical protein [Candidatus Nealsonbacteria bacterium]